MGGKKTLKDELKEPVIVAISFPLFVKYRVIHSLKKNATTALPQNLSGDTRQPSSRAPVCKIAECQVSPQWTIVTHCLVAELQHAHFVVEVLFLEVGLMKCSTDGIRQRQ